MLDTIKIKLTKGKIKRPSNFRPEFKKRKYSDLSETEKNSKSHLPLQKYILNRNIIDEYCPAVEVYEKLDKENKRVYRYVLVECSVPKLIRENNLMEIHQEDHLLFVSMLKGKLHKVGIVVDEEEINDAVVTKLHVGKNVLLPKEYSVMDVVDRLRSTEMGKTYDISEKKHVHKNHSNLQVQIRNSDEVFSHYSGSRNFVFYDKVRDMQKPKNKSTDKDKTDYEKELIEIYNLKHKEVLRFEYRLINYKALQSEVNKGLKRKSDDNVLVKDIFNEHLWKTLVVNAWNKILNRPENQMALKFDGDENQNVLRAMLLASENKQTAHGMNTLLISYGLAHIASEYGMKYVTKEFGRIWSSRSCEERLHKKVECSNELMAQLKYPESIEYFDTRIKAFEQVTEKHLAKLV